MVLLLVLSKALFHSSKISFNDYETLIDKFRSIDCSAILIVDPNLVINIDESTDYKRRTRRICIILRNHNNRRLFS